MLGSTVSAVFSRLSQLLHCDDLSSGQGLPLLMRKSSDTNYKLPTFAADVQLCKVSRSQLDICSHLAVGNVRNLIIVRIALAHACRLIQSAVRIRHACWASSKQGAVNCAQMSSCCSGLAASAQREMEVPPEVLAQGCLLPRDLRQPLQQRSGG